jgi:hypothetical protein
VGKDKKKTESAKLSAEKSEQVARYDGNVISLAESRNLAMIEP